jgi:hypothetical protein
MKKEYNIKDTVWIALGESKLIEGRVVEIIDLVHLNEGWDSNRELYIIEIKTGIDDVYEVRDWNQISSSAQGPLNMYKTIRNEIIKNNRYLKKVGLNIPIHPVVEEFLEDIKDLPAKKQNFRKRKPKND